MGLGCAPELFCAPVRKGRLACSGRRRSTTRECAEGRRSDLSLTPVPGALAELRRINRACSAPETGHDRTDDASHVIAHHDRCWPVIHRVQGSRRTTTLKGEMSSGARPTPGDAIASCPRAFLSYYDTVASRPRRLPFGAVPAGQSADDSHHVDKSQRCNRRLVSPPDCAHGSACRDRRCRPTLRRLRPLRRPCDRRASPVRGLHRRRGLVLHRV